jgi:hypothetical protein
MEKEVTAKEGAVLCWKKVDLYSWIVYWTGLWDGMVCLGLVLN